MIENLFTGFSLSLSATNLLYCLIGVTIGTVVGLLPGLGPVSSIALLLPLTHKVALMIFGATLLLFLSPVILKLAARLWPYKDSH